MPETSSQRKAMVERIRHRVAHKAVRRVENPHSLRRPVPRLPGTEKIPTAERTGTEAVMGKAMETGTERETALERAADAGPVPAGEHMIM